MYTFHEPNNNVKMTPREFFFLTWRMRKAQKEYFALRTNDNLRRARALEGDVDREIRRVADIMAIPGPDMEEPGT